MPFSIIGMGIGFAMLPSLSEKAALGQEDNYKELLSKALKIVVF